MKSYTLIFVALVSVFFYIEYANAKEICPEENCIMPHMCEQFIQSDTSCKVQGTQCCSVVKSEFKTYCRHHGGMCTTDQCPSNLRHETVDCTSGQICCVLV